MKSVSLLPDAVRQALREFVNPLAKSEAPPAAPISAYPTFGSSGVTGGSL